MTKAAKIRRMLSKGMSASEIAKKLKCPEQYIYKLKYLDRAKVTHRTLTVTTASTAANAIQVGGNHYKKYGSLQPWDIWTLWNLNPFQAAILKYVVRYRDKEGVKDLEKARHFLDKLIEVEGKRDGK
jgi:Protein of unknwon function (DUF3310)